MTSDAFEQFLRFACGCSCCVLLAPYFFCCLIPVRCFALFVCIRLVERLTDMIVEQFFEVCTAFLSNKTLTWDLWVLFRDFGANPNMSKNGNKPTHPLPTSYRSNATHNKLAVPRWFTSCGTARHHIIDGVDSIRSRVREDVPSRSSAARH